MSTTTSSTRYGALTTAVALVAAGAVAGAGVAAADPAGDTQSPPSASPHDGPIVHIGDLWGRGDVALRYGNAPVCADFSAGHTPKSEVHITLRDSRPVSPAGSLDANTWLPLTFSMDVEWHNEDTGVSGTDHTAVPRFDAFSHPVTGPGRVTGTITATASALPVGGSVEGIGSHTIRIPFETQVPDCQRLFDEKYPSDAGNR